MKRVVILLKGLFASRLLTLVEDVDVQLMPDGPGAMEPDAYVGQRFTLDGRRVVIVSNTMLTWTVRRLTIWERYQEYRANAIEQQKAAKAS